MSYEIYLVDSSNSIKLDTDALDMNTTFSVADVKDISLRKDNITKQVVFKGTKTNNEAFGSMFHLNRVTDSTLDNKFLFNYNPLRTVDVLVYEDGMLLLKGNIRVLKTSITNGIINYYTLITGHFIEFKEILIQKKLSDLNFTDLRHRYKWNNIKDSWDNQTERYNSLTDTFSFTPFSKGSGYVYPYIDYGHIFKHTDSNGNVNNIHGLNFRPAVYLREYFKKIFNQPELDGFSYEIKGDNDFIDRFDSVIIPNSDEKLRYRFQGFNLKLSKPSPLIENHIGNISLNEFERRKLITINNITTPPTNTIGNWITVQSYLGIMFNVSNIERNFTSDASVSVNFSTFANPYGTRLTVNVVLVERDRDVVYNLPTTDDWQILGKSSFEVPPNLSGTGFVYVNNQSINFSITEREWSDTKQIALMTTVVSPVPIGSYGPQAVGWDIDFAEVTFPKNSVTPFTVDILLDSGLDIIVPTASEKISQMDFLKAIMTQFNLYVYTEKRRPKHLIFEKYNDYYAMAQANYLPSTALNWSNKIDYSSNIEIKSNIELPKSYVFTYKDDTDFLNADYKKAYGELYGTFRFTDSYGVIDEKKVELLFSPSPVTEYVGSGRVHPAIYTVDNNNKKPMKSNLRIMFYNGLKNCNTYSVLTDLRVGIDYNVNTIESGLTKYPQAGSYFLDSGYANMTPLTDIHWGIGQYLYFIPTSAHINCPTAYFEYYVDQITDLTNSNVTYVECDVNLNELDITNLDLKEPVFIDLGKEGHAYFKVLKVEYSDNKTFSKVGLQKIYTGDKR